jgi:hypothetical protein
MPCNHHICLLCAKKIIKDKACCPIDQIPFKTWKPKVDINMQQMVENSDKNAFQITKKSLIESNKWFRKFGSHMELLFGSIHDTKW